MIKKRTKLTIKKLKAGDDPRIEARKEVRLLVKEGVPLSDALIIVSNNHLPAFMRKNDPLKEWTHR
jgi:hypothetical protein